MDTLTRGQQIHDFFLGKFLNFSKSKFLQRQEENVEENDPENNANHLNDDSYFYTSIDACRNLSNIIYILVFSPLYSKGS